MKLLVPPVYAQNVVSSDMNAVEDTTDFPDSEFRYNIHISIYRLDITVVEPVIVSSLPIPS